MELSLREAATLLSRSPRTLRAQLSRGDLPGVKRNGRWWIDRRRLPMTEAQRRVLQEKADALRRTVESALPSRVAATPGQRSRSIADLAVFRRGAALLTEVREAGDGVLASDLRSRTEGLLEAALLSLAEAVQQYDRELKLAALNRARGHLARVAALLLLRTGMPPADPVFSWVVAVETEVIPAVAGLARWADGLGRRGR